ncbi:MAG: LysR family transcriptional regulator [Acidobacteria bacterium]|nr:LysR family transcriptional regulator [Acidobacteriota bacterium]
MEWLNYHHLLYFWTVVREGTVTAAAETLRISQPALSTQLRQLEESLGEQLLRRAGRRLELTDAGRLAFRYADEIFTLGREFQSELKGRPTGRPLRLVVGISDALPKLMVHRLLRPALELPEPLRLSCRERGLPALLDALFAHEVDLVLSDAPHPGRGGPRAFNHLLGECGQDFFAAPSLLRRHRRAFPACLDGAPMLLPSEGSRARAALERWLEARGLRPVVAGDFDDSALLKTFGAEGEGFFLAPAPMAADLARTYGVRRVGSADGLSERIYAVSTERRLVHPGVLAILKSAQEEVFA